jgi:F-type H+-transporting ATPase subunit a
MSGGLIVAILLSISPFIFPIIMSALGLLTGTIQAYIFSILATVYITAAVQDGKKKKTKSITTK